jgi:hypothetical protein
MRKDIAVAFYPIEQERREAYVTDGVPLGFYFVGVRAFHGIGAWLEQVEASLRLGNGSEGMADDDCGT